MTFSKHINNSVEQITLLLSRQTMQSCKLNKSMHRDRFSVVVLVNQSTSDQQTNALIVSYRWSSAPPSTMTTSVVKPTLIGFDNWEISLENLEANLEGI